MTEADLELPALDATHAKIDEWLRRTYAEKAELVYALPQLIQVGLPAFMADLSMTRGWADRVLSMLEEGRKYRVLVERLASELQVVLDETIVLLLADPESRIPKALKNAAQRLTWAGIQHREMRLNVARFEEQHEALRALIKGLEEQFKHLLNAKNDLRSQLWAARLHMMLGDLTPEAATLVQQGRELDDESMPGFHRRAETDRQLEAMDVPRTAPADPAVLASWGIRAPEVPGGEGLSGATAKPI